MDKTDERELEDFVDKIMDETILESPSSNFTDTIMSQIVETEMKASIEYKPLMPKSVLVFLCIVLVGLTGYLASDYSLDNETWFGNGQVDLFFERILAWPQILSSSKITMYAVLFFGLLFLIQIPWLKRYFDNSWMLR
ncbi:hypothetical protein FVB32_17210 [Flagellimonas hymeniacidonis]|uniref:Uncharacterized protein n=1 Tax=Flagellimonas hymeniacidonis TaxID=2603628 RepID=A0A5C8UZC9_9FLAO|nr:hypothetical protein [Flagellimonas hymeniacidonis]TXN34265.1 hypothetical protein FVB32_17210 [Flagellimonas hymeniacidonis]